MPVRLGVNIDHVATLRQARGTAYPDILEAALAAERGGADGITVHLREDRRHIQDADVPRIAKAIRTKLNLEMACVDEMIGIGCAVRPSDACLVPERREEITTEGGLDVTAAPTEVAAAVACLQAAGVRVSLFVDPEPRQVDAARAAGADAVEIHTGAYAGASDPDSLREELARIRQATEQALAEGMIVNAGHGLTLANVAPIAAIPGMGELNIGHSIVADALFVGLVESVRRMRAAIAAAREGEGT